MTDGHDHDHGHAGTRIGVLVMAHGTPGRPQDIEPFYTHIRRGRPPSPEQLAELVGRYDAIGGISPLTERTRAQVDAIASELHHRAPGRFVVRLGTKHAEPSVEDGVDELMAAGVDRIVGLVLTPHRSTMGSGEYFEMAADAIDTRLRGPYAARPPRLVRIEQWYDNSDFVDLMADRVIETVGRVDADEHTTVAPPGRTVVLFTAHSLPERVVAEGDRYPEELAESAALIADTAEIDDWQVAWQSAGRTPDPWLGPDVLDVIRSLPDAGAEAVVVCPVGFVADHLEVLYDLDIEAASVAGQAGLRFAHTPSLNDEPRFVRLLADIVEAAAGADDLLAAGEEA